MRFITPEVLGVFLIAYGAVLAIGISTWQYTTHARRNRKPMGRIVGLWCVVLGVGMCLVGIAALTPLGGGWFAILLVIAVAWLCGGLILAIVLGLRQLFIEARQGAAH